MRPLTVRLQGKFKQATWPNAHCRNQSSVSSVTARKVSVDNADLVRSSDHDAFLLSFFYPPQLRDAYLAVRAFDLELRRIPESVSSQSTGLMRYAWWKQSLDQVFKGGTAPNHPVLKAIERNVGVFAKSRHHLDRYLEQQSAAFTQQPTRRRPALSDLAAHSLDTDLQLLSAQSKLLVETRQVPGASLKSLSRAQSLVQLLRRSPNTLSRHRLDYPADVLEQQGIVNDQLYQSTAEGQAARMKAARSIAQIALSDLQSAAPDLKSVKSLRPLYLSKIAHERWLARLSKQKYDVLSPDLMRRDWQLPLRLWWSS